MQTGREGTMFKVKLNENMKIIPLSNQLLAIISTNNQKIKSPRGSEYKDNNENHVDWTGYQLNCITVWKTQGI